MLVKTTAMAEVSSTPTGGSRGSGWGTPLGRRDRRRRTVGLPPVSGRRCRSGSPATPSAAASAGLSRKYGLARREPGPRRPGHRRPPAGHRQRARNPTCSGRSAVVAATSASRPSRVPAAPGVPGLRRYGVLPDRAAAPVLERFGDWARAEQPDELGAAVIVQRSGPGIDEPVVAIRGLYAGSAGDAVRALQPVWEVAASRCWTAGRRPTSPPRAASAVPRRGTSRRSPTRSPVSSRTRSRR